MRKALTILTLSILLFAPIAGAQSTYPEERVVLSIDRNVYFSQEVIRFSAAIQMRDDAWQPSISEVLFTDLVTQDGRIAVRYKSLIIGGRSEGSIFLSEHLPTGTYLLRAYTQYQSDNNEEQLCYSIITVVNPNLRARHLPAAPDMRSQAAPKDLVSVRRSANEIHLERTEPGVRMLSVRLIKGDLALASNVIASSEPIARIAHGLGPDEVPDIHGVALHGELIDKNTGIPITDTKVIATVIGDYRQLHADRTDERGQFNFSLPQTSGIHQVFVCALRSDKSVDVLIKDEFASAGGLLEWKPDSLTMAGHLLDIAFLNHQMCTGLQADWVRPKPSDIARPPHPLNSPTTRVETSDYVALTSVSQMLDEIVPMASARKNEGIAYVHVFDPGTKRSYNEPLLMVDHLPVQDAPTFLKTPIDKVSSVDVFAEELVIGQEVFQGAVNLNTHAAGAQSTSLPKNCVVVEYATLTHFEGVNVRPENINLDICNTLFWSVLNDNTSSITIPTKESFTDDYILLITGYTDDGSSYHQTVSLK
ncbi:MAG: hypothetical protein HQ500_05715 [Flavobacteriales bacterium]|nr:hypothetical protein [Flavobacteriales bacterium]